MVTMTTAAQHPRHRLTHGRRRHDRRTVFVLLIHKPIVHLSARPPLPWRVPSLMASLRPRVGSPDCLLSLFPPLWTVGPAQRDAPQMDWFLLARRFTCLPFCETEHESVSLRLRWLISSSGPEPVSRRQPLNNVFEEEEGGWRVGGCEVCAHPVLSLS